MAQYNYAHQGYNKELMVRAVGRDLGVSPKVSIELCNFLRNKNLQLAKQILRNVIEQKQAIPYRRFNKGVGHKSGMASGRYPVKTVGMFLKLLESAEVSAQNKGLSTGQLSIVHLCAHSASRPLRSGRKRRCVTKRAHIEVVLQEKAVKDKEKKAKKPVESKENVKKEHTQKEDSKNNVKTIHGENKQ